MYYHMLWRLGGVLADVHISHDTMEEFLIWAPVLHCCQCWLRMRRIALLVNPRHHRGARRCGVHQQAPCQNTLASPSSVLAGAQVVFQVLSQFLLKALSIASARCMHNTMLRQLLRCAPPVTSVLPSSRANVHRLRPALPLVALGRHAKVAQCSGHMGHAQQHKHGRCWVVPRSHVMPLAAYQRCQAWERPRLHQGSCQVLGLGLGYVS